MQLPQGVMQLPGEYAGDKGVILVLIFLALLLAGGSLLLLRSFIDFMHNRTESKREKNTNKRKAA